MSLHLKRCAHKFSTKFLHVFSELFSLYLKKIWVMLTKINHFYLIRSFVNVTIDKRKLIMRPLSSIYMSHKNQSYRVIIQGFPIFVTHQKICRLIKKSQHCFPVSSWSLYIHLTWIGRIQKFRFKSYWCYHFLDRNLDSQIRLIQVKWK